MISRSVLGSALVLVAVAAGCARKPAPAAPASEKAAPGGLTTGFCVVALDLSVQAPAMASLTAESLRSPALDMLGGLELVAGLARRLRPRGREDCAASADREHAIGIELRTAASALDAEGRPVRPEAIDGPAELVVLAVAHAERGGEGRRAEIGLGDVRAAVPMTPRGARHAADFAALRLVRAAAMATADALGQLAVRHASDAVIRDLLGSDVAWKVEGALREAGERGLFDSLARIRELATGSRKDIAVVAIATLGRLGRPESAAVLKRAIEGAATPEVIDAALIALIDIGNPEAIAAVRKVAREHPSAAVRRRARRLLGGR